MAHTDDVRDFGKAGRPAQGHDRSLVLFGHLLLSNDLSLIFGAAQEAFIPPAIARFRSELNAFAPTIVLCSGRGGTTVEVQNSEFSIFSTVTCFGGPSV